MKCLVTVYLTLNIKTHKTISYTCNLSLNITTVVVNIGGL